jgi:hypothetical protein
MLRGATGRKPGGPSSFWSYSRENPVSSKNPLRIHEESTQESMRGFVFREMVGDTERTQRTQRRKESEETG